MRDWKCGTGNCRTGKCKTWNTNINSTSAHVYQTPVIDHNTRRLGCDKYQRLHRVNWQSPVHRTLIVVTWCRIRTKKSPKVVALCTNTITNCTAALRQKQHFVYVKCNVQHCECFAETPTCLVFLTQSEVELRVNADFKGTLGTTATSDNRDVTKRCIATFLVLFFNASVSGPAFSGPAFFYPGNLVPHFPVVSVALWSKWSLIGLSFSGPAFSVDPTLTLPVQCQL